MTTLGLETYTELINLADLSMYDKKLKKNNEQQLVPTIRQTRISYIII